MVITSLVLFLLFFKPDGFLYISDEVYILVVVGVRVPAYAVLEADVEVIPETAVQHHVSHHPNPVFNLLGGNQETCSFRGV